MNKFLQILSGLFFAFVLFASAVADIPGWLMGVGAVLGLGGYIVFGVLSRHE